jgi:hypothetical protein
LLGRAEAAVFDPDDDIRLGQVWRRQAAKAHLSRRGYDQPVYVDQ